MRKLIAAINLTLDGIIDHTAVSPDEKLHQHYADLLRHADIILYGRITYELMKYWKQFIDTPSGEKNMDDFAEAIDKIPKIVFSHTLTSPDWQTAGLADEPLETTVKSLKQQSGGSILVGSRSIIIQLMKLDLIDEYQFCVHPVIAGSGQSFFDDFKERKAFSLLKTEVFDSGAVIFYYARANDLN